MIIVDTREQNPLWNEEQHIVLRRKLDEGDYTTESLLDKAHIERKSGCDLYGSLIQNHSRFRAEILRAVEKGLKLAVFVECPKEIFFSKKFDGGYRLKCHPAVLKKIVETMSEKYKIQFVWCQDRDDFRERAIKWFKNQEAIINAKTTTNKEK